MTIWKFALAIKDEQEIGMPAGAEVLSVHAQYGAICLWALLNPDAAVEQRTFRIHGTGHLVLEPGRFLGTVLMGDGDFVWHVFEVRPTDGDRVSATKVKALPSTSDAKDADVLASTPNGIVGPHEPIPHEVGAGALQEEDRHG
jgi:hypothetical protein